MRRFLPATALIALVMIAACARASSDTDSMQPGTPVTVTMKDGAVVTGRLVESKPGTVVVDPSDGGEWKTLSRDQIASLTAQQPPTAQPGQTAPAQAPGQQTPGRTRPKAASASGRHAAPEKYSSAAGSAEPAFREITIPAGTLLHARLDTQVGSDTSRVEDRVAASLSKAVVVDDQEVVPAGSSLRGVVTQATPAGRVKGRAEVAFRFDVLAMPDGDQQRVQTQTVAIEAPATKKNDALKIGVPAAGGAILGGILGGGKGAAIGGAVGGGAGTAVVLSTPGKEVHLPAGSAVTVKLIEAAIVRVPVSR